MATDSEAIQQTSIAASREVNGVAFASGGTVVIAACADGTVQLTGRRSATQLALAARAAAGRELTLDERRLHRLHVQAAGNLGPD